MTSYTASNFQRSQSKVWWGNDNRSNNNDYGFASLPSIIDQKIKQTKSIKQFLSGNSMNNKSLSPELSATSWSYRRGSPGSLKSQDSGFADSPTSELISASAGTEGNVNNLNNSGSPTTDKLTPKKSCNRQINEHINQRSPSICSSDRSTPPTVIRKKINYQLTNHASRRISFSAPQSPVYERIESPDLVSLIDSMNYSTTSPLTSRNGSVNTSPINNKLPHSEQCKCDKDRSLRRGKVLSVKPSNRKLLKCVSQISIGSTTDVYHLVTQRSNTPIIEKDCSTSSLQIDDEQPIMMQKAIPQTPKSILKQPDYNNETVNFGEPGAEEDPNNNKEHNFEEIKPLPKYSELFPTSTSTPNATQSLRKNLSQIEPRTLYDSLQDVIDLSATLNWETCTYLEYTNPLLNGHAASVHFWLDELRTTYCHEVLSTLQTKSVVNESTMNSSKLNSATVGKIIRNVQSKARFLQIDFDEIEHSLEDCDQISDRIPLKINKLCEQIVDFVNKLRAKNVFRITDGGDYNKFEDNISHIVDMTLSLHASAVQSTKVMEPHGLLEDFQILKRYILITIRLVFEKLVKMIMDRLEEVKCDLILRSNLSMISMLSNMNYTGFASLDDAFLATDSVQILLAICLESKLTAVRALSLRALATICSTKESIRQFEQAGGVEILNDIINQELHTVPRSEPEIREALSVFTQITAPWHGRTHYIVGLKECVESLVENITDLAVRTSCCQTLLLCVASLNNLTRMQVTALFSIMSNETIRKLKLAIEARGPGASIFLFEQLISMLYNMSSNKKCHHHLANKQIITFIIAIFKSQFHAKMTTRAENTALNRTIKNILYIFLRLIGNNNNGVDREILDNNVVPIFSKIENNLILMRQQQSIAASSANDTLNNSNEISKVLKLLNDSLSNGSFSGKSTASTDQKINQLKLVEKQVLESYV